MQNKDQSTPSGSGEEALAWADSVVDMLMAAESIRGNESYGSEFNHAVECAEKYIEIRKASRTQETVGREELVEILGEVLLEVVNDRDYNISGKLRKKIMCTLSAFHSNPLTKGG